MNFCVLLEMWVKKEKTPEVPGLLKYMFIRFTFH